MDKNFVQMIEKVRSFLLKNGLENFSLKKMSELEDVEKFVSSEEELVEKVFEYERMRFESIFDDYNFNKQNAIDILFVVNQEIHDRFEDVSPSVTMELQQHFPDIYAKHMEARMKFIFDKIQINVQKGVAQGMYRSDLSSEMVGRMYLSRLEDIHNPELYPPERFKFGTIYDTMIDQFVKSIATEDGLKYYRQRKQLLGVLRFGR